MSIIVVNLQGNRAVFQILTALLRFSFDSRIKVVKLAGGCVTGKILGIKERTKLVIMNTGGRLK